MAYVWLYDNTEVEITPADVTTDHTDIVLMLQGLVELRDALRSPKPDRATCDRLARMFAPYVKGVTVEALGAALEIEPDDIMRILRRILLHILHDPKGLETWIKTLGLEGT